MNRKDRCDLLKNSKSSFVVYWHYLDCHTDPFIHGYVGVAKVTKYADRWSGDFSKNYKGCKIFLRAIKKYGEESIHTMILRECQTIEDANRWEFEYRPLPSIGWNIRQGGGNKGCHSSGTKDKISFTKKSAAYPYEKIFTPETREKIRQSKIGNKNMLGKRYSEEVKLNMTESARKRGVSQNFRQANYRKVECVETGRVFESQVSAEKETGICHKKISACCTGKRKTAGGFHWRLI